MSQGSSAPTVTLTETRDTKQVGVWIRIPHPHTSAILTPDEADKVAAELVRMAGEARQANEFRREEREAG